MNLLKELKDKNTSIYPIKQLVLTNEKNYNLERIKSLKQLKTSSVYNSTLRCLEILDTKETEYKDIISEVLLWMDISKVGTKEDIKEWKMRGYNLFTHNIGSAQIYKEHSSSFNKIIYTLIKTHGLIGQYIKGEVNLNTNKELYDLIINNDIKKSGLKEILLILNECIIKEVSPKIYEKNEKIIEDIIDKILEGNLDEKLNIIKRFELLNEGISEDDKIIIKNVISEGNIKERLEYIFNNIELWYYKSALKSFDISEQIKILLIIYNHIGNISEITFSPLMKDIYLEYKNIKRVNIYKERIIEKYLEEITYDQIINNKIENNINLSYSIKKNNTTLEFNFVFSKVSRKLIEFCEVAYGSNNVYNKSVLLLYDLFGFRKDNYDRFYNEIDYLETMNSSIMHKSKLLDFIVGENVLDVGPGGGALMDLILDSYKDKNVYGIDISSNVIEQLNEKSIKENRAYNLVKGNALNLEDYFKKGSLDTIIYSSIIHELFSYINYEGKKFNYNVIKKALQSAYNILSPNGRIIIRDGIMSENEIRIIEFKNKEDMKIFKRYVHEFKGREIKYELIFDNKVKLDINDAMEFLYTYTWGEESFALEVQEQFGYYTPFEYEKMISETLENSKIVYSKAFLQDGYKEHLESKINLYDEEYNSVTLPNSTYILVIEKTN